MERRSFLTSAATGFALTTLPDWFSARAEAAEAEAQAARPRRVAANDKIRIGLIGAGGSKGGFRQGLGDARNIASRPGVECVAVCDVELNVPPPEKILHAPVVALPPTLAPLNVIGEGVAL